MAVLFVLVLVGVFHGYVTGYPTKGMLKIIHIFILVFEGNFTSLLDPSPIIKKTYGLVVPTCPST